MTSARRKPPKPEMGPQLLTIPNRAAVLAEFKRCAPASKLINIELERSRMLLAGDILKLCAFIRDPGKTIEHVMPYRGKIDEGDLVSAARMLAQSAERVTLQHRLQRGVL